MKVERSDICVNRVKSLNVSPKLQHWLGLSFIWARW